MKHGCSSVCRGVVAAVLPGLSTAVLAQSDPTAPLSGPSGEIVVTATRSDGGVPLDQVAASVTVLDPALLDLRQTRDVSDILRDVPGVAVSRSGAPGGLTQVRIRGSEANHVLVLIDGIEASDPFQGQYDFGGLVADEGARVEVLRGQQSALYGSDAIGGVIQVLTATGDDAPGTSLRVDGGSLGTVNAAARTAGVVGPVDYAITGTYQRSGGYPVAVGGTRDVGEHGGAAAAKLIWTVAPAIKLTAVARYTSTDADYDNIDGDPISATFGQVVDSPGVRSLTTALYGLLRGEASFLDGRLTSAVGIQDAASQRNSYDPTGRTSGDRGNRIKGSAETTFRFGSPRVAQQVTLAVDLKRETFRNTDPSGVAFVGSQHIDDIGLVGSYDVKLDDVATFGAAVRRDLNSRFADTTTYRLTAGYTLHTGTKLHADAGSGIKNPTVYDLYDYYSGRYIGNPGLKPERSDGYEVGVEQPLLAGAVRAGVTWFDNRLHDAVYLAYLPPAFEGTPENRSTLSKEQGVEAFVTSKVGVAWRFDAAYTHVVARQNGVEEVRRAPDIASASLSWSDPAGRGSVTGTVRYNGPQTDITFTDPSYATEPVVTLHGFTLVNLTAQVRLTGALSGFARVENLLDQRYQEVFSYRGSPRAAYVGVRARL